VVDDPPVLTPSKPSTGRVPHATVPSTAHQVQRDIVGGW
jgi:hypothetical protein